MKKLGLLILVCVAALALYACSGGSGGNSDDLANSRYVGTWKVDTISFKDASESFDTEWTLELAADGTGKSISEGDTEEFTWTLADNGFKTKGAVNTDFTDDGDSIKTKVIGVELRFNKVE